MGKETRFTKANLSDAMFYDASTTTTIRYEMRKMIEAHPDVVETLAQAKDGNDKYLFQARDINWIMYQCRSDIEKNPEKVREVLNDAEKIKVITGHALRFEGFARAFRGLLYPSAPRNEFTKVGNIVER